MAEPHLGTPQPPLGSHVLGSCILSCRIHDGEGTLAARSREWLAIGRGERVAAGDAIDSARRAAGLLAFITIDLSVQVSRFAFVIAALGYIFMPARSAKRRRGTILREASLHYQLTVDRGITDRNPRSTQQKIKIAIIADRLRLDPGVAIAFCTRHRPL